MSEAAVQIPVDDTQPIPDHELEDLIPTPVGYHLLIKMPEIEQTYGDSGILKSSKTLHEDTVLNMVGLVLDAGEEAYGDKSRFPNGPWCKQGDYVMFRANSGTRFRVAGQEYRLMNDDSIEAVVKNPSAISRVN